MDHETIHHHYVLSAAGQDIRTYIGHDGGRFREEAKHQTLV